MLGTGWTEAVALAAAFVTSVAGVVTFTVLSLHHSGPVAPDWPTGIALGPAASRAPTPGHGSSPGSRTR